MNLYKLGVCPCSKLNEIEILSAWQLRKEIFDLPEHFVRFQWLETRVGNTGFYIALYASRKNVFHQQCVDIFSNRLVQQFSFRNTFFTKAKALA